MEPELASRFAGPRWDTVRGYVEALLARDDRAVFEALERLDDVVRGVADALPEEWGAGSGDRDAFAEFLARTPKLEEAAGSGLAPLQRVLRSRSTDLWDLTDWSDSRVDEAHRVLDDWIALKAGAWLSSGIADRVRAVLPPARMSTA
jgi:hypothetical protein